MGNSTEPKPANKKLGQIIKKKREEKKLTQKQLAQIIGVPEQTMAGMESGRRPPTPTMRRALCREFEIENLLSLDTDIDLSLLNLIQESLELFSLNENELDFIINELKVSFGFDIEHITIIEDTFEKQRKNLKSINNERQKYIKFVIQYILDIIYSVYRVGQAKSLYGKFSYFLLYFYKKEFEYLVKFPTEYKTMMNVKDEEKSQKSYFEVNNKEKIIEILEKDFKEKAKNNWFLDTKIYRFDFENNKDVYNQIRGKNNGFYYANYINKNTTKEWIKEYSDSKKVLNMKYNNCFKKFGTVYEFQLLMLETLERIEKSYVLHNKNFFRCINNR